MAEEVAKATADQPGLSAAAAAEKAVAAPAVDAPDGASTAGAARPAPARDARPAPATAAAAVANGDGAAAVAAPPRPSIDADLKSPELFLNRELTWLTYDRRVLSEAEDERSPLLERVKFLAITSSNLDEFFMKRIGGLKQQVVAGIHQLTPDGRTPQQQITECYAGVREIERRQRELLAAARRAVEGARNSSRDLGRALSPSEQKSLRDYYFKNIFPLVTPHAMDPAHPFPVHLQSVAESAGHRAPSRRRRHPDGAGQGAGGPGNSAHAPRVGAANRFVPLEDVMGDNARSAFPGDAGRRMRIVPRDAQCQHRARRGRGRGSARR